MADFAYGFRQNTNYVITSNTMYEIGRNYRFNNLIPNPPVPTVNYWTQTNLMNSTGVAIQSPGTLWAWGQNQYGQLGLNTSTTIISSPIQVGALSNWSQIACGYYHVAAIKTDGSLWAWGYNNTGQLGLGDTTNRSSPVQVGALTTWTKIFAGGLGNTIGIKNDGTLWTWGANAYGQLGNNSTTNQNSPVQLGALSIWVTAGNFYGTSYFIQSNGTLWSCGYNLVGQLGNNSSGTSVSSPIQVGALSTWAQIGPGCYFTLAIQSNGTLWVWGNSGQGQLGNNSTTPVSSPIQVGALTTWIKIAAMTNSSAAIQSNGTLWAWGYNGQGQLGLGDLTNRSSPVQVGNQSIWTKISGSSSGFDGLQSPGTLWTWGYNGYGALGYDATTYRSYAIQIGTSGVWTGFPTGSQNNIWGAAINSNNNLYVWGVNSNRILNSNYYNNDNSGVTINGAAVIVTPTPLDPTLSTPIKSVSIGDQFGVYVQSNGTLWSWGNLSYGQTTAPYPTSYMLVPARTYMSNWASLGQPPLGSYSSSIQSNGTLWTWGLNSSGQLGLGDLTNRSSPVQVGGLSIWSQVVGGSIHSLALQSPGTLWAWGYNALGQLGLSDLTNRSSPVQVGALSIWTKAACGGYHSLAIQSNGTLWAWGYGGNGQLGNNNSSGIMSSPIQVGALSVWTKVACGGANSLAIQSNGTLWAWGYNGSGQLGQNTAGTNYSSPVQVGTLSVWTQIACGYYSTAGIQSNGTLWAWGNNAYGQLGQGNTTNYSSPVQVGSLSTWTQIACGYYSTAGIQSNGTLWAWGNNSYGQLGTSNQINYSSPVQVGTASNWVKVSGGQNNSTAIQNNSTQWIWGNNSYGQLGYTAIVAPIQIDTQSNWSQVCCGLNYAMAVQNTGVLYAWGNNSYGQLGTGDLTHRSSLTQVGTASNWSRVACGYSHTAALQSNGTLWAWGTNSYGQLGQGNFTNTSTPVQVGTLSRYVTVYAMNYTTLAETQ